MSKKRNSQNFDQQFPVLTYCNNLDVLFLIPYCHLLVIAGTKLFDIKISAILLFGFALTSVGQATLKM